MVVLTNRQPSKRITHNSSVPQLSFCRVAVARCRRRKIPTSASIQRMGHGEAKMSGGRQVMSLKLRRDAKRNSTYSSIWKAVYTMSCSESVGCH